MSKVTGEESMKSFWSDEDWMFSEKMSPRSVQPERKSLQERRKSKCSNNDFSG